MSKFLRWFMVGVAVLILSACGGGGGNNDNAETAAPEDSEDNISGYVVDDPIENATITLYSLDGEILEENITTNSDGYYEVKINTVPAEYIVSSSGGKINGEVFDGELFAYCQEKSCNLTPLSTLAYQYTNLLLDGTFQEKYNNSKNIILKTTGITEEEIDKIDNLNNFDFTIFRQLVKTEGFSLVMGILLNDLVDEYLDEESSQKLFSSYRARVARPLPASTEEIVDEDNNSIELSIHGADDTATSKGFLIDVVATQKVLIFKEDGEEVEDNQTVFLGFNIGEYQGKLNSETTVLAKLFMSDMTLALLPSKAKEELIATLISENRELYDQVLNLYRFVIQEGLFYEPLFYEKFDIFVGKAQVLNNQKYQSNSNLNNIQTKLITLQKQVLLYSKYREDSHNKIIPLESNKALEQKLSSYLDLSYDSEKHTFSVSNKLPIYLGLRETQDSYSFSDVFTTPLVKPAEGGAVGLGLTQLYGDDLVTAVDWITGKDLSPQTTFNGELLSPDLFPSASKANSGYKEFEIFKNKGGMPTVRNVGLGISAIFKFFTDSGVSKTFDKAVGKISDGLDSSKKVLGYAQTGVDIAKGFSQFLYLMIDEEISNEELTTEKKNELKALSSRLKRLYKSSDTAGGLISGFSSLIPDMSNRIAKNDAGYFITQVERGNKPISLDLGMAVEVLGMYNKGVVPLDKSDIVVILVGGNILNLYMKPLNKNSILVTDEDEKLSKLIEDFEKQWGISFADFTMLKLLYNLKKSSFDNKSHHTEISKIFNRVSTKDIPTAGNRAWKLAESNYLRLLLKTFTNKSYNFSKLADSTVDKFLSPAKLGQKLASWKRLSVNDSFSFAKDIIIKEIKSSGENLLKGIILSVSKQAVLMMASGGSAAVIKGVHGAVLANELAGIGWGVFATPDIVPFAVEVDSDGILSYKSPEIKLLYVENGIKAKDSDAHIILSQNKNETSPLVILSSEDSSLVKYDLSYELHFANPKDNLEGSYNLNDNWSNSIAMTASMSTSKRVNDRIDSGYQDFATKTWAMTPEELSSQVEESPNAGSVIDIISILNKQEESFFQNLFSSQRSTTVTNMTRGIFRDNLSYLVYEPIVSQVKERATKIENFERDVFKISNAKDLRKDLRLYQYDETRVAITNNTGHAIYLLETSYQGDEFVTYGNQYYLSAGENKLFPNDRASFFAVDAIVLEYGKSKGLKSMEATLDYLSSIKNNFIGDYSSLSHAITNTHSFVLDIREYSFVDVTSPDKEIIDEDTLLDVLFRDLGTKAFLSSAIGSQDYIIAQYAENNYEEGHEGYDDKYDEISFILKSGSLMPDTISKDAFDEGVVKEFHESQMSNNYIIKDIRNYALEKDYTVDEELIGFTITNIDDNKIKFTILKYQEGSEGRTLYLHIDEGIEHFMECKNSCIDIGMFNFNFIITSNTKLYDDVDKDNIIDTVDLFPSDGSYQFDTDRDGMPDAWEIEYGLDPDDSADASLDFDKNGISNLQEFLDGTDPKSEAPIANAGLDTTRVVGATITLDASGSSDDVGIVDYAWIDSSTGDLLMGKIVTLTKSEPGDYSFTLIVTDDDGLADDDEVIVTVREKLTTHIYALKVTGQDVSYVNYDDGYYETGIALNYTPDSGDILDRVTGLRWRDGADTNSTSRSWEDASAYCLSLGAGWRLPTREELSGLIHYDYYNPATEKSFAHTANSSYWSGSSSVQNSDNAWSVNFAYGTESTSSKTSTHYTRCTQETKTAIANAGGDIVVEEGEDINLSAIYSTHLETIDKFIWTSGVDGMWSGQDVTIRDYYDGSHTIKLTTTDSSGNTNTDEVVVTIVSDNKEIKKTGQDVSYASNDDGDYERGIALNYTHEDGDILDRVTGLRWQDSAETSSTLKSWEDAKEYCGALDGSWRLPTREELSSLVHYDNYNPAIDESFGYTANSSYWTLSTAEVSYHNAWVVNFAYGTEGAASKTSQNYVRCVHTQIPLTANAGEDQFVEDGKNITLVATDSIHTELISEYIWAEDGEILGYGEVLELDNIRDGEHNISLTTMDIISGTTSIDYITVTMVYHNKKVKKTGQNVSYASNDDGYLERGIPLNYTREDTAVLDRVTGLRWRDDSDVNTSTYSWDEARAYCSSLDGEWRLPMREELSGLLFYDSYNPAIERRFEHTASSSYWTLSTSQRNAKSAWAVNFACGTETTSSKSNQHYTRCVDTNSPARANAGADLFVFKGDSFVLSGENSPHKELVTQYTWVENGVELGYGETLSINDMLDGEHKIYLMIEDEEGNTDNDGLLVTMVTDHDKIKQTGQSEVYSDYDDGHYQKGRSLSYGDNGATVYDGAFDITWQDDGDTDNNAQTWEEAKEYCATLTLSGSWRLPTRLELSSLIHYAHYNPAIDDSFDSTAHASYWSISTSDKTSKSAWVVNFAYGTETTSTKTNTHYTRCVKTN